MRRCHVLLLKPWHGHALPGNTSAQYAGTLLCRTVVLPEGTTSLLCRWPSISEKMSTKNSRFGLAWHLEDWGQASGWQQYKGLQDASNHLSLQKTGTCMHLQHPRNQITTTVAF
jgi:hypothetical protein